MFFPLVNDQAFGGHNIIQAADKLLFEIGRFVAAIFRPATIILWPQPMNDKGKPACAAALLLRAFACVGGAKCGAPRQGKRIIIELSRFPTCVCWCGNEGG